MDPVGFGLGLAGDVVVGVAGVVVVVDGAGAVVDVVDGLVVVGVWAPAGVAMPPDPPTSTPRTKALTTTSRAAARRLAAPPGVEAKRSG